MNASLPLFYFKPTICWVDDDQIFLDAVNISFSQHYNCLTYNDPVKAKDFFKDYIAPLSTINFKRELTESDLFGTNDHFPVDINMPIIKDLVASPNKSNEVALLIIDYHMPNMNGLAFCEQIKSLPIKKILLTGEATHEKAIEAFNKGIIDKFIKKDACLSEKLNSYIDELIYTYFQEKTAGLISHLEASRPSVLTDPVFINFFNTWCNKNNIVEFYLTNKQGNFLVKDKDGKLAHFVVMSDYDKNKFLELNDEMSGETALLIKQVSEGKMVPFFGLGNESWDVDTAAWSKHFYPAQVLVGRESYSWAVVDG